MKASSNVSSRGTRKNKDLPVFRTGGEDRDYIRRVAAETSSEPAKRLQRKPPVPTAAAAAEQVAVGARSASSGIGRSLGRERVYPSSRGVRAAVSPTRRDQGAERQAKGTQQPELGDDGDASIGVVDDGRGTSRVSDRKHLLLMLRQAVKEMDGLRQDVASANRERAAWKQRDDDLSLTVSRLEDRCKALEGSVRAESDAADAEAGRTKAAEARFARLLAWAREEEKRRLQAEEKLRRACEVGQALEARGRALKEEARQSKRQLEERRFKLEGALEDLRNRTSENERLEMQATTVRGQVEALRELADARELEVKEQRERLARLVEEAKCMSSENVSLRKHMTSEQERWRAAERSRAKQDERRRMDMEHKCEDLHALRYRYSMWLRFRCLCLKQIGSKIWSICGIEDRTFLASFALCLQLVFSVECTPHTSGLLQPINAHVRTRGFWAALWCVQRLFFGEVVFNVGLCCRVQELEARLSGETARRQGAEEDARRSQEMERRTMEELMEGRKAAAPVRTGLRLARYFPPQLSDPEVVPATENTWSRSGIHGTTARGAFTTATMTSGGAISSTVMPDVLYSSSRVRRDDHEHPHLLHSADAWPRQEATSTTPRDHPAAVAAAAAAVHTPSTAFVPQQHGHPPPPMPPPPPLSPSSLRESLRRPGCQRSPSPAAAAAAAAPAAAARPDPSFQPRRHGRSPVGLGDGHARSNDRRVGFGFDDGHPQEGRHRPRPRRPPSEASSRAYDQRGEEDSDGRSTRRRSGGRHGAGDDCWSEEDMGEWWAGDSPGQGVNGKSSSEASSSGGEVALHRQDTPLHVVSL
ncbi:unnamed protein product [Pylaiella littoralis]